MTVLTLLRQELNEIRSRREYYESIGEHDAADMLDGRCRQLRIACAAEKGRLRALADNEVAIDGTVDAMIERKVLS